MLKILIVDDEPDLVLMLKSRLESQDYAVRTASDGMAALKAIKDFDPDLVVLDIHMPRMDGYRFLEELRSSPGTEVRPAVIVLTARRKMRDVFDPTKISAFLEKPFNSQELISKVGEVCRSIQDKKKMLKALLVGSDWDTVRPVKKFLESQALQVIVAFDGPGAIELAVVHSPDIIFCPSAVSGMDVLILSRTLRQMPATRETPFIVYDTQNILDPVTRDKVGATRVLGYDSHDELQEKIKSCLSEFLRNIS